jgi:hypothetical protein
MLDGPLRAGGPGVYLAALFGLKGNAEATFCVPAGFSATMSPAPEASGSAGAHRRLAVLLFFDVFDDLDDFAMCVGPIAEKKRGGSYAVAVAEESQRAHQASRSRRRAALRWQSGTCAGGAPDGAFPFRS